MPRPPRAIRHRRAIGLTLLGVVLPGSAQYLAGNRRLGILAIRIWVGIIAVLGLLGLGWLVARAAVVALLLWGPATVFLRVAVWAIFLGWLGLLINTWCLTRPPELSRPFRLILSTTTLALAILAGLGANLLASAFVAAGYVSDVLQGGGDTQAQRGRYNILLLGVDAAADRQGLRPDSMNVVSIDATTGRTVIFGLPRNLVGVPFPESSPLHDQYPTGFRCAEECMLNGVYTLGEDNAELYPGQEAGLVATKEVIQETLGLELNYYAMIDLAGFESLVDAMGGIRLTINKPVPIGGGSSEITEWIQPGTNVHLDGYRALWFARSRADSDDYERMVRQKCVLSAMAKQLDPSVLASRFVELAKAGSDVVRTDVGADKITELVELALKGKAQPIETVNFSPPLINTGDPDFELIRRTVAETIAASQQLDAPAATSSAEPAASTEATSAGASPSAPASPDTQLTEATAEATVEDLPVCELP